MPALITIVDDSTLNFLLDSTSVTSIIDAIVCSPNIDDHCRSKGTSETTYVCFVDAQSKTKYSLRTGILELVKSYSIGSKKGY